jgi:hypothetical protein
MYYLIKKDLVTNLKHVSVVFKVIDESKVSFKDILLNIYLSQIYELKEKGHNHYEYDSKTDKIKQFTIGSKPTLYREEIKEAVSKYIIKKRIKKLNRI